MNNSTTDKQLVKIHNMIFKDLNYQQYYLGHEIYIRICLLDEIFKYEILDINTICDIHCKLKRYFLKYRELPYSSASSSSFLNNYNIPYDSTIDIMLRKYLEFFKIIKPNNNTKRYLNIIQKESNNNNNNIPLIMGDHIRALVKFGEFYLDGILNNDYYYNFNVNLYMV